MCNLLLFFSLNGNKSSHGNYEPFFWTKGRRDKNRFIQNLAQLDESWKCLSVWRARIESAVQFFTRRAKISRAQFRDSVRYHRAHRLKFHRIKLFAGYKFCIDDDDEDQVTYGNHVNGKSACISPHRTLIQITYVWFNSHRDTRERQYGISRSRTSRTFINESVSSAQSSRGSSEKYILSHSCPNQIWETHAAVKSDITVKCRLVLRRLPLFSWFEEIVGSTS